MMVLVFLLLLPSAHAQSGDRSSVQLGIGILAGPTSGLSMKALMDPPRQAVPGRAADLVVSFNGRGFLHLSGHSLTERNVPDTPMRLFLGPGIVTELNDRSLRWGVSTTIGGYFEQGPYDILVALMPRLFLMPQRNGVFGAAVGLRYRL
jgi:hypothetical protein